MLGGSRPLSTFIREKSLLTRSLALFGPRITACRLCAQATDDSAVLCFECHAALAYNNNPCRICAQPLTSRLSTLCADCLKRPKPYYASFCPLIYSHPTNHLIHEFKHSGDWALERLLTDYWSLIPEPLEASVSEADIIVPIPTKRKHLQTRGFSHTHNLARRLSKMLDIPQQNTLEYRREPSEQKKLTRTQRLANLTGSMHTVSDVVGRRVIIVDDVVTTCATVINASKSLLSAGADSVFIVALARTP